MSLVLRTLSILVWDLSFPFVRVCHNGSLPAFRTRFQKFQVRHCGFPRRVWLPRFHLHCRFSDWKLARFTTLTLTIFAGLRGSTRIWTITASVSQLLTVATSYFRRDSVTGVISTSDFFLLETWGFRRKTSAFSRSIIRCLGMSRSIISRSPRISKIVHFFSRPCTEYDRCYGLQWLTSLVKCICNDALWTFNYSLSLSTFKLFEVENDSCLFQFPFVHRQSLSQKR